MLYTIAQLIVVEGAASSEGELAREVEGRVRAAQAGALREAGYEVKVLESEVRVPYRDEALRMPRKKHMASGRGPGAVACELRVARKNVVSRREDVTCKLCIAAMEERGA